MQVSARWLKDYAPVNASIHAIADRLTMTVNEVDEIRSLDGLRGVVVAEVTALKRHPGADKLWVAEVRTGREKYQIVAGANNLAVGEKVPLAKPGVILPDGVKIAARTFRGITSEGMLCSPRELGAGEDHSGVWLLPADAPVGAPLAKALGSRVDSFELDVPANRPDLTGHLGIARETAAAFGTRLKEPDPKNAPSRPKRGRGYQIKIQDPARCARFALARIRGLSMGASPDWVQERLTAVGLRPINAVVDITNFVMLEYGQPLHAYDAAALTGVVVYTRNSRPDETIKTLDGKTRKLPKDTLLVADRTQALGVAGIMGGANSEVSAGTTDLVLECASFDGPTIRRASRQLGLRTDASARFEKNLPPDLVWPAIRRAIDLIIETCGGTLAQLSDQYPKKRPRPTIRLDRNRVASHLGLNIPTATIRSTLTRLGFEAGVRGNAVAVKPPYWRPDVQTDADLIEEIARSLGYDQLPSTMPSAQLAVPTRPLLADLSDRVRESLIGGGFTEVLTHSLVGSALLTQAGYSTEGLVAMQNPLSADHEFMRRSMAPRHLESVMDNLRWHDHLRLFELGRTFRQSSARGQVTERDRLFLTVATKRPADTFNEIRGALTTLLNTLNIPSEGLTFTAMHQSHYAAGRQFDVGFGQTRLGSLAEYGSPERWKAGSISLLSLDLNRLAATVPAQWKITPPPAFPPVRRDLSLFVPDAVTYGEVRKAVEGAAGPLLRSVGDPEEFRKGRQRSLTIKLSFGARDRTLTDAEVTAEMEEISRAVVKRGWKIRE